MHVIPSLTAADEARFQRLTAQESWTPEGAQKKIDLIETLIWERHHEKLHALKRQLMADGSVDDDDALDEAERRLQKITVRSLPLGEVSQVNIVDGKKDIVKVKRRVLIVSKGSGDNALFRVMVPAHVDVVKADPEMLNMTKHGDRRKGRTWDMGAAVFNGIDLAADLVVPEGMHVDFVFTDDEEKDSTAIQALIKDWDPWHKVDLVLSQEIGPLVTPPAKGDLAPRYILGRTGKLKLLGTITIDPQRQGHGALDNAPNAKEAHAEWEEEVRRRFYRDATPLQREHSLLGKEKLDLGAVHTDDPDEYMHPSKVDFKYSLKLVPPSQLESALAEQKKIFEDVARVGQWATYRIHHSLTQSPRTSYAPFCMDDGHEIVQPVRDVLRRVSGLEPVAAGGSSVADENLAATDMLKRHGRTSFDGLRKGVISIPIIGNNAHNPEEWVSWSDIARTREFMRALIEDPDGFRRFLAVP